MSEVVVESQSPVRLEATKIIDLIDELRMSTKVGGWSGERPVNTDSPADIYNAAQALTDAYRSQTSDGTYPAFTYLADGNTQLGIGRNDDNSVNLVFCAAHSMRHEVRFTLTDTEGKFKVFYSGEEGNAEELTDVDEINLVLQAFADTTGAARWDFVFGSEKHDRQRGAVETIEKSFEDRQAQIDNDQAALDADKRFFTELKRYRHGELASTILMQAYVRLNGVRVAAEQASADTADKYDLIASLLTEFAEAMPGVAISDPELQVAMRYLSELKHPHIVDVLSDSHLQRFAQRFHHVYNGVATPNAE